MVSGECMAIHSSIIKVGSERDMVEMIIECDTCGRLAFRFPIEHLPTIATACAETAKRLKVSGIQQRIGDVDSATEDELDASLDARRNKAHLN
jgi:hypothetical protein